ncbi:MAG: DegT/DnrJ/EryC1/StrS family aminotransferase, partial [Deltaproteobacteria bacterium]|nr:DegT/DnrJ/EryC1/StrS family aminotransferase [Deltaproteobacteria bacterium]
QGTLFYAMGKKTRALCDRFGRDYGFKCATATSSGTASIHVALGCLGVGPGDEVIVSPITDIGSIIGILFQNAIPVFADLEPYTFSPDPNSIADRITDRTRAIMPIHLVGNAADMNAINEIATERNIAVIEDCAQAWMTKLDGKLVGTFGAMGCYSLNEFKHISAGDGGLVGTNDENLGKLATLWADKAYDRPSGLRDPQFLAPNYRMNELTAAVSLAQMDKLQALAARRTKLGRMLTCGLSGIDGLHPLEERPGSECTYWFYMFRIDEQVVGIRRDEFVEALAAEGVVCSPGYTANVMYKYTIFQKMNAYPHSNYPFEDPKTGKCVEYPDGLCPMAEKIVEDCVYMPLSENFTETDIEEVAAAVRKVSAHFQGLKTK